MLLYRALRNWSEVGYLWRGTLKKNIVVLMVASLALGFFNCLFRTEPDKQDSEFVGNWSSSIQSSYTVGDSIYRDSLKSYLLERGIDIERFYSDSNYHRENREQVQRLENEFVYSCMPPIPCDKVIWRRTRQIRFTQDSIFMSNFKNGELIQISVNKYRFDKDSIYLQEYLFEYSVHYVFLSKDTLVIHDLNENEILTKTHE